jgi:hypothetical protein
LTPPQNTSLFFLPVQASTGTWTHQSVGYFHCGEEMTPPGYRAESTVATFPGQPGPTDTLAAFLATKVLRCRRGFQMALPR